MELNSLQLHIAVNLIAFGNGTALSTTVCCSKLDNSWEQKGLLQTFQKYPALEAMQQMVQESALELYSCFSCPNNNKIIKIYRERIMFGNPENEFIGVLETFVLL